LWEFLIEKISVVLYNGARVWIRKELILLSRRF